MTNREAIEILGELKKCYLGGIVETIDMAIEAVKAQEPCLLDIPPDRRAEGGDTVERLTLRDDDGRAIFTPYGLQIYCSTQATADCICKLEEALQAAQGPRVMSIEEFQVSGNNPKWLETKDGKHNRWTIGNAGYEKFYDNCMMGYLPIKEYGKRWRCWTSRPTDEQRKATPWN